MSICICLGILLGLGMNARAEEYREKTVTAMDENGNIYEVGEESDLEKEDAEISVFSLEESGKVVNFNTKGSVLTEYLEDSTRIEGYTCGAYAADAAYLGEYRCV